MGPELQLPVHPCSHEEGGPFEIADMDGSDCSIQTLYEGPRKCKCCRNWVIEYPDDLRAAVEDQLETKQKALVVRMSKNHNNDGGKPLILHSIVVQSSSLRITLGEVFEGFKGITPSLKKLVFKAPFQPFHHRWTRFTEILERQKQDDPEAAAYTQLLYDVLDAEIRDARAEIADLLHNRVITYGLLWALFEPGVVVYDGDRFYVVQGREYDSQTGYFTVDTKYVDWNGHRFGYVFDSVSIKAFPGTREIPDLPLFPAVFHPNAEEVKARAIERGRKFEELAGIHYRTYFGTITYYGGHDKSCEMERQTSGRIVIDTTGYLQSDRDDYGDRRSSIVITRLNSKAAAPTIHVTDDIHQELPPGHPHRGHPPYPAVMPPPPMPRRGRPHPVAHDSVLDDSDPDVALTPHQLLLCTPTVRGYSLKLKLWGEFDVNGVGPITFNETAFPNLMLPPTYKDLILSFVEARPTAGTHAGSDSDDEDEDDEASCFADAEDPTSSLESSTTSLLPPIAHTFDDLIEGKGLGIILLLVGNPGTGKTLTAEAVADKVRRPLYVLSAGELGQKVADVESRLRDALELAERWDAVLLFDECDVFLQERSAGANGGMWDLARNEIVAVFLRQLEYYRGILFMTTNRADTLDKAFHSRIHLTLRYPDLSESAKEHIWRHFTKASGANEEDFSDEVYERLAGLPMNGRQIKNTVKIATLVAARQRVALGLEHVRAALQAIEAAEGVEKSV